MSSSATTRQHSYRVEPVRSVQGSIAVPGDKSISHRALMLAGIAEGRSTVSGFLESEDCLATMRAMRALGVQIQQPGPRLVIIDGVGLRGLKPPQAQLDMGNSGTAMRLMTGLLSGQSFESVLIGDESLMKRPMERVAVPLRHMGAVIETNNGRPPVRVRSSGGNLKAIHYDLPVASAQVKSAVLLAGLYADGMTSVTEPAVTRDHSERMLQSFGVNVQVSGRTVRLKGPATLKAATLEVPGDISSAAFFMVAGSLAAQGVLTLRNVGINPSRTGIIDILRLMGAEIRIVNERRSGAEPVADIEIERRKLRGIDVPEELVPLAIDELPVVFIAAAGARGTTRVTGAEELRVKESDRIAVMAEGLKAAGISAEVLPDGIVVHGGPLQGGRIDSHGDHRIAMSFAVASVIAQDPIEIADVANVATSFPGFPDIARAVGLKLQE